MKRALTQAGPESSKVRVFTCDDTRTFADSLRVRASGSRTGPAWAGGIALMEVVAALAIFFVAAMFVMDGLSASLRAAQHAELEADAADLAVTVLSEVQMGLLEIKNEGPSAFDEELFPGWSWELSVSDVEDLPDLPLLRRVEVIVRNHDAGFTRRTAQLVWDDAAQQTTGPAAAPIGGLGNVAQQLNLPPAGTATPTSPEGAP